MRWWATLWNYITTPTNGSLGPMAQAFIIGGMLVAVAGILLYMLAEPITNRLIARTSRKAGPNMGMTARPDQQKNPHPGEIGPGEYGLRIEWLAKLGAGITVWGFALALSLLLRVLGSAGLSTRVLPTLVLVLMPFLVGYAMIYRLVFFRRYLEQARRIDARKALERGAKRLNFKVKKGEKAKVQQVRRPHIALLPGKAAIGLFVAPVVYYMALLPHPVTEHDLHQFGMLVAALLGYLIGLAVSLGDGVRNVSFWSKAPRG